MSLFKARDWWSTVSGFEEFHTNNLLVTTSLSPDSLQYDECILVGSFSGVLRGYRPSPGGYKPDHLLIEKQLDAPIVQLAVEHIVDESVVVSLVVLHPRLAVFYTLGIDKEQLSLTLRHKHMLKHVASGMLTGPLGRSSGRGLVLVQSMDGVVTVLDHSDVLFTCTLPGFCLPGPIGYNPRTDTMVTVGSPRQLEVYRYQSLLGHKNKTVKWEWSVELGEEAVDVKVVPQEDGPALIMVLGERTLYCFRDDSKLMFSRKLYHHFSVLHPYKVEKKKDSIDVYYLLAGHSQLLQVLRNETIVWAAQLPHIPVAMTTANFRELEGVVITLDEVGHLQCSYLGTDPSGYTPLVGGATTGQSLKEVSQRLKELSLDIKNNEEGSTNTTHVDQQLEVNVVKFGSPRPVEGEESEGVARLCIECDVGVVNPNSLTPVTNVTIDVGVATPFTVHPSTLSYPCIDGGESETFVLTFVCSGDTPPGLLEGVVTVTYLNENKAVQTIDHTLLLPIEIVCNPCPPGDGCYKVTIESSHPCVNLADLYPGGPEGKSPNAIAFKLLSGPVVTLITSKTSDRYRIQSDDFPSLGIFVSDLVGRLGRYHGGKGQEVKLKGSSPLPLPEFFELIEEHYKMRVGLRQCGDLLGRHAHQFRAIQKRLLSRYKDKTPVGLSHMDTLLDGTYMQVIMLGEKYEELSDREQTLVRQLSTCSLLVTTFLRINCGLSKEEACLLHCTFAPSVLFTQEQGWEEVVDMGVTQLLRSCLAKTIKDQSTALPALCLPNDLKVKHHIALLCDRLTKGGKLTTTRSLIETTPTTLGHLPALLEEGREIEQ